MRAALADGAGRGAMRDHKTLLQERVQAEGAGKLRYIDTAQNGPPHDRAFSVEARLENEAGERVLASADGSSKKEAQQRAAELALLHWNRARRTRRDRSSVEFGAVEHLRPHHATVEQDGLLTTLKSILEIIIFAIFIVTFIVQPFRIPSGSMEPTLRVGDFLLVDKQSYAPEGGLDRLVLPPARVERGDLVVFHYPVDPRLHLVKRVVGLPGERIRMRGGRVLVNGQVIEEPYAFYSPSRPNGFRDDFPSLLEADPNVDLRWWIRLRSSVVDRDVIVPPDRIFCAGRQPQRQRGQPVLGVCAAERDCGAAAAGVLYAAAG